jgi:hypothetical protein
MTGATGATDFLNTMLPLPTTFENHLTAKRSRREPGLSTSIIPHQQNFTPAIRAQNQPFLRNPFAKAIFRVQSTREIRLLSATPRLWTLYAQNQPSVCNPYPKSGARAQASRNPNAILVQYLACSKSSVRVRE